MKIRKIVVKYKDLTEADWVELRHVFALGKARRCPPQNAHCWMDIARCRAWLCDQLSVDAPYEVPENTHDPEVLGEWGSRLCNRLGYLTVYHMIEAVQKEYQ